MAQIGLKGIRLRLLHLGLARFLLIEMSILRPISCFSLPVMSAKLFPKKLHPHHLDTRCEKSSPLTLSLTAYPNSKFSAAGGRGGDGEGWRGGDLTESRNLPPSTNSLPEIQLIESVLKTFNFPHKTSHQDNIFSKNIN